MVQVTHLNGVQVITIEGDHLDASNYTKFKEEMGSWTSTGAPTLFDVRGVKFIDSSGLGAILAVLRDLKKSGGDLKISSPGPAITTLFELVRLQKIIDIYETRDAALGSFRP